MKRTVGRRLDAMEQALDRLHDLPDIFEPGRGTEIAQQSAARPPRRRAPRPDSGLPRRPDESQGRLPAVRGAVDRRTTGSPAGPPNQAAKDLDALSFLWQLCRDVDGDWGTLREQVTRELHRTGEAGAVKGAVDAIVSAIVPHLRRLGMTEDYIDSLLRMHGGAGAGNRPSASGRHARDSQPRRLSR